MKIYSALPSVLAVFLFSCQSDDISEKSNNKTQATSKTNVITQATQRDHEWWAPSNALSRANSDIKSGNIKIYYIGGRGPFPPGIKNEDRKLIDQYPIDSSGTGCMVFDLKLRELQEEYGAIYNRRIIDWIKEGK